MAIETAADRAAFLDSDEFGAVVTVAGVSVPGIFDAAYLAEDILGAGLQGASPRLTCRTADVAGAAEGAAVVVDGAAYTLRRQEPDGTGMTVLILTEV